MSEQETTEYYNFLLQMEWIEFEQELIEIVSTNSGTIISSKLQYYPHSNVHKIDVILL